MKKILLFFLSSLEFVLRAQVSITGIGIPYQQDFNSLVNTGNQAWADNSTLPGWYSSENTIYADDGNDVFGGRMHSYGSANSSERAIGGKSFSSLAGIEYGVRMMNNTANAISYFQVSFTGEQWRQNTNNLTLKFYYQVGATGLSTGTWTPETQLDFPAIAAGTAMALDGNLPANQSGKLAALTIVLAAGQEIWFKWGLIGDNNSPGLAVDDLIITAYNTNPTAVSAGITVNQNNLSTCYSSGSASVITNYYSEEDEMVALEIYDLHGRLVASSQPAASKGKNQFTVPAAVLPDGIFVVSLRNKKYFYVTKFLIHKQ